MACFILHHGNYYPERYLQPALLEIKVLTHLKKGAPAVASVMFFIDLHCIPCSSNAYQSSIEVRMASWQNAALPLHVVSQVTVAGDTS